MARRLLGNCMKHLFPKNHYPFALTFSLKRAGVNSVSITQRCFIHADHCTYKYKNANALFHNLAQAQEKEKNVKYSLEEIHQSFILSKSPRRFCISSIVTPVSFIHLDRRKYKRDNAAHFCTLVQKHNEEKNWNNTMQRLKRIFLFNNIEVSQIAMENAALVQMDEMEMANNYKLCRSIGLMKLTIRSNTWLLTLKEDDLKEKVNITSEFDININNRAPIFKLDIKKLRKMVSRMKRDAPREPGNNRIKYLAELLGVDYIVICTAVAKYPFLATMRIERINGILKPMLAYSMLIDVGVQGQDILKNPWVLYAKPSHVKRRLKEAKKAGVTVIKPWMVHCEIYKFEKSMDQYRRNLVVTGNHMTIVEYLAQRLECDKDEIRQLARRYPQIKRTQVVKVKSVIDLLYEAGYKPKNILRLPQVMFSSIETIEERLEELKRVGHKPSSLTMFCVGKKIFTEYLNRTLNRKRYLQTTHKTL